MAFDCATWRSISFTEAASSSAADAMSRTLAEASAEADAAPAVLLAASSAAPASCVEAASIWSVMRPSSASVASTSAEKRAISRRHLLPAGCARVSASSTTVRLSSSLWRMASLEHGDRARQRADLVAARRRKAPTCRLAGGDRLGDAVMCASGLRHAAPDHAARRRSPAPPRARASRLSSNAGVVDAFIDLACRFARRASRKCWLSLSRSVVQRLAHDRWLSLSPQARAGCRARSVPSRASSRRNSWNVRDAHGKLG